MDIIAVALVNSATEAYWVVYRNDTEVARYPGTDKGWEAANTYADELLSE